MIDAQAAVAAKRHLAVIPPAVLLLGLLEQAEGVGQAQGDERLQRVALRHRKVDPAFPFGHVVHIARLGRDIVVAEDRELRMRGHLGRDPGLQRRQPGQLVGVLVGADFLPVGHVRADEAHATDRRGQQALLWIVEVRIVAYHVLNRQAGQDRHAVVSLLARERDLVAGSVEFGDRELVVGQFGLLDAEHVNRIGVQPLQQMCKANF